MWPIVGPPKLAPEGEHGPGGQSKGTWTDVTRIHTPAPAKDWTNEGTHTRLDPPHKGPLHIPPARCTTVAARAVLLDTRYL